MPPNITVAHFSIIGTLVANSGSQSLMDVETLKIVGQVAGIGGLALGVFFTLVS